MKPVTLLDWAAWSPGLTDAKQWRDWALSPTTIESEGAPEVKFVPAMLRRRCDPLSRMMLQVARSCCSAELLETLPTVFASRHGSFVTRVTMLYDLAHEDPISPARFSHSVHNAQSGLFSIWARNRAPSISLTAGEDTFAHGFLEAVASLGRPRTPLVLYVIGDQAIPPQLAWLADQKPGNYALALLLARDPVDADSGGPANSGIRIELEMEPGVGEPESRHPDAIRFVSWLLSNREMLRIDHGRVGWVFRR